MNMNTTPLEAETRVLIDRSLENLGWKFKGKDKNVFFEQPKTELERKKLGGKRPDYVLYSKEREKPLIVIEAKKKGSRIDEALEQGIGYARAIDAPLVFATDGVFCKAFHTGANRPPILNGEEIDEFIREALAQRYLTSYEVNTVSPKVQYDRKELIRIFDEANNMLRGEGLRAGIERFGEFANILFLKLISESEQAKKERGEPTKFDMGFKNIIVRRPDEILPEYVAYILTSQTNFMMRLASGATFKEISKENFCTIQIPLLPIEQQRQLVLDIAGYRKVIAGAQAIVNGYRPHLPRLSDVDTKTLDGIATFRPSKDEIKNLPSDTDVSFVPMASLNTFDASFEATETRKLGDVSSGFTYFKNNDILLAKITPCFENGKAGIAHGLKNGIGFGSTEYIVIRADTSVVYPEWIFYYINTREFIDGGKPYMTGTAGQQRIDINYVKQYQIPVPSLEEQKKLLDEIHCEQALIEPSKKIINVFTAKINARIKEIWGE